MENYKLIFGNALLIDEKKNFTDNYTIISNLPYNISTQLLIKWIYCVNSKPHPSKMILMFQKEVAERIIANHDTKKYGRLSILPSAFFNISKIADVSKYDFMPNPKVESTVLLFKNFKKTKN